MKIFIFSITLLFCSISLQAQVSSKSIEFNTTERVIATKMQLMSTFKVWLANYLAPHQIVFIDQDYEAGLLIA